MRKINKNKGNVMKITIRNEYGLPVYESSGTFIDKTEKRKGGTYKEISGNKKVRVRDSMGNEIYNSKDKSKRKKNKAGYIYTTREMVGSGHILECFYIVLDADGNIHLYKRLAAKDGKTKLRKVAVNIPQKLAEWGVEMEKMMKYTGGTYDL